MALFIGKEAKQVGVTPSIILNNPKYPHNLGQIVRAASCFGIRQVWYTGDRIKLDKGTRLPREERLKGYGEVDLLQFDYPFDQFKDAEPVAVEIVPNAEILTDFEHPDKAVYVFGPEDGSLSGTLKRHCHRFVTIPTRHCVNLAAAVYILLYDRHTKRQRLGIEPMIPASEVLEEPRGWEVFEKMAESKHRGNLEFIPDTR